MGQEPGHVFTPARPASERVFATRTNENLQDRVAAALVEPGYQLVLSGPTGVGKTSLVRVLCAQLQLKTVEVNAGPPLPTMLSDALAFLEPDRRLGHDAKSGDGDRLRAGPRLFSAEMSTTDETTVHHERRERSLSQTLIQAMEESSTRILFIDNFEQLDGKAHREETVDALAGLVKAMSDRAGHRPTAPKLVIAGISSAAEDLVTFGESLTRRTLQVRVPRMTESELGQIVDLGSDELDADVDAAAKDCIVKWSDGFPYYTHTLAKHAVAAARQRPDAKVGVLHRRTRVTLSDFEAGLRRAVTDDLLALRGSYRRCVDGSEERRRVLAAIAACTGTEATFKDIKQAARGGSEDPKKNSRTIRAALKQVVEREPRLVVQRERPSQQQPIYRFRDPLMRAYVRIEERYGVLLSDVPLPTE